MTLFNGLDILICPACRSDLKTEEGEILCSAGHHHYRITGGIPLLFWPNEWNRSKEDVTDEVKIFYERTPFPNYDGIESIGDLIREAEKGVFARLLNEQIPLNTKVLEVGCGTGQLSLFLSTAERSVIGTDMCLHALELARDFKEKNHLGRVEFYQMNLFKPIFKEESFDVLICNGVLHHTSDPFLGFHTISRLVRKGGFILVGLYNKFGRIATDIRRFLFKTLKDRFKFMDPRLRRSDITDRKKLAWFLDQYKNPYESKHTIGEVLRWFDQTGFEFLNSVPKLKMFQRFSENERLFVPNQQGNRFDHFQVQTELLFTGSANGGFFLMIGKKK